MPTHTSPTQRGASLIEALVAFLIVALSLVGAQRLQSQLRLHADVARERGDALRLAQQAMEQMRAGLTPSTRTNGSMTLHATSRTHADAALQTPLVQTRWSDRHGQAHTVTLASATRPHESLYAAALTLPPRLGPLQRPFGGHPAMPRRHQPLGDGRAVHKPRENGTLALVFDLATGQVLQRCQVDARRRTHELTSDDLQHCDALRGSLINGHLRFAGATPGSLDGEPLPVHLSIVFSSPSSGPADCEVETMRTVRLTRGEQTRTQAVPLEATARELQATELVDLGERFSTFTCVIADARWSGQLVFEPQGWTLGETARDHRICRLGAPHALYRDASGSLRQQNFLVMRGDQTCPGGPTHNVAPAPLAS
jgi:Tfp pilus assembly protein PilV